MRAMELNFLLFFHQEQAPLYKFLAETFTGVTFTGDGPFHLQLLIDARRIDR